MNKLKNRIPFQRHLLEKEAKQTLNTRQRRKVVLLSDVAWVECDYNNQGIRQDETGRSDRMMPVTSFLDCRDPREGAGSDEGKDRPARTVSKVAPSVSDREDLAMLTTTLPTILSVRKSTRAVRERKRRLVTKDETADVANC